MHSEGRAREAGSADRGLHAGHRLCGRFIAMELAKVKGQVVSTVRDSGLPNLTFLLVDIVDEHGNVTFPSQVAADTLGAGEGEMVLLVRGSSARMILEGKTPLDLSVVGIIDQISSGKKAIYSK
jgi:microcompartment protein CcmK/EutM